MDDLAYHNMKARLGFRGRGLWIQTKTGKKFPMDGSFRPEDVCLEDIAHGLSQECRYQGQCRWYSVAEHSVWVMCRVRELTCGLPDQTGILRSALFHDAAESFVGDIPSPMKKFLGQPLADLEYATMRAIAAKYDLRDWQAEVIHQADIECRLAEGPQVLDPPPVWCTEEGAYKPWRNLEVLGWSPPIAKLRFLHEAEKLGIRD